MNAWKVILATLVIFGAGLVTGALFIDRAHGDLPATPTAIPNLTNAAPVSESADHGNNRMISPPGPLMPYLRKNFLENLDRELNLTAEQHEHIEKILAEGQEHTKALWEQIAPQIKQEYHDTKKKIQAELTPEQTRLFEAMMKKQRKPRETKEPETNSPVVPANFSVTNAVAPTNP